MGAHLTRRLKELQGKHDVIGDVRGPGLMMGLEMVKDRATKVQGLHSVYTFKVTLTHNKRIEFRVR